jgi:hypothetical protein
LPGLNRVDSPQLTVDSKIQGAHVACAPFAFWALLESRICSLESRGSL